MAYHFKPNWKSTLFTLSLLPILIFLGFWQLQRAEYKRDLEKQLASHKNQPAVDITQIDTSSNSLAFQPVLLHGHYQAKYIFLLDNQIHRGRAGFSVINLFKPVNQPSYVLVNRGWVALGQTRTDLPTIETPEESLTLQGEIYQPDKSPLVLKDLEIHFTPGKPVVVQKIDIVEISQKLSIKIFPNVINLNSNQRGAYQIISSKAITGPEKHIGYAVQWFLMAGALCILYFYANTTKTKKTSLKPSAK